MLIPTITLQPGDSGDNVRELQRRLVAVSQLDESQVNGSYDGPTTEGVRSFQGMHALKADGIAGPRTIRKLNAVVAGTASSGDGENRQEEEEVEKEQETAEEIAVALDEQKRELSEDEMGLKQEKHEIAAPPPPPAIEETPDLGGPETTEALFLDDPSLETNMVQSDQEKAQPEPAPKEVEAKAPKTPEAPEAQKEMEKAATLPEPKEPREPIKFNDPALDNLDRSLPEPVKMEVKEAGVVMMKNGVKQAAVPPEMDIGGPSQTPQQQKQQTAELG